MLVVVRLSAGMSSGKVLAWRHFHTVVACAWFFTLLAEVRVIHHSFAQMWPRPPWLHVGSM